MSRSLIRKNQLDTDIADLVSGYGNNFFVTKSNGQFNNRPTVNGTGVLLQGEAAGGNTTLTNVVFTTGNQTIAGSKNFTTRPTFNNQNLITTGDLVNLEFILSNFPNQTVVPLLFLDIETNNGLFDTNDSTNYKIPWNRVRWVDNEYTAISSTVDITKTVTYNSTNKNIYIKETGIYNVDLRYGSFNMIDSTDFLRARLRSSTTPIEGGLSTNPPNPPAGGLDQNIDVLAAFAQGPIGVTQNGEAMCAGFTTFYITEPLYVVADFLHFGAFNTATSLARGFPVFNNTFGNRPFLFLTKVV
jgi:hypothetical protein